jgi:two-component system sensor histidine kinase FlrB
VFAYTLRQLAEKECLANRLQTLLTALPAGVIVLDELSYVCECNRAACDALGEPLLGEHWTDVVARCVETTSELEHDVILRNGRTLSVTSCRLGTESGQILLLQDVTETRSLQKTVDHQRRLTRMGEMVAALAHQVRTPIAAALLYANNLTNAQLRAEDRERFSGKIIGRLQHLERIVSDMLLFAKSELRCDDTIALTDLFGDIVIAMAPVLAVNHAHLVVDKPIPNAHILGNRSALQSVFQNIILNAIQAGNGNMSITLSANQDHDAVHIRVHDNGPGVAPEVRDRIFDPFFTTQSNGTGLGLAVARSVLKAHGGDIVLEGSTKGAAFSISLPLIRAETALISSLAAVGVGRQRRIAEQQS